MKRIAINQVVKKVGKKVTVSGWVHARRDHGKLIFIDLRDRSGLLQVVFSPDQEKTHQLAGTLRSEYVIMISGVVKERPANLINPKISTGTIELSAEKLEILNPAKTPPFEIESIQEPGEEIRMKYRYLDLRRSRPKNNLVMRHKIIKFVRDYFDKLGFLEIETPILTAPAVQAIINSRRLGEIFSDCEMLSG